MASPTGRRSERSAGSTSIHAKQVQVAYDGAPVLAGVDLEVAPGQIVSLLGPSGCGKTTLLRAIAGLERVQQGEISVGNQVVSSATTHLPPEQRRIGMVFQDWALFPHLSVGQNVSYGLDRRDRGGERVEQVLEMVGLSGLAKRDPHTLSGGQQQRVALARALAPRPTVLLLDEPFSNLDTSLRVEVRTEVHRLLTELDVTTVFVTHDQDEAFVLGKQVAVMDQGSVVQQGSPAELYSHPVSPWVAGFVGEANLVPAQASGQSARSAIGTIPLCDAASGEVRVLVRPEDVDLEPVAMPGATPPPTAGAAESVSGAVNLVEYYGHDTTYEVELGNGERLRVRLGSAPRFGRGDAVVLRYRGGPAMAYPGQTPSQTPDHTTDQLDGG